MAHEIGHFVLHKDIYDSFRIKNENDFYRFMEEIPLKQYGYLETQANKFANYLLVPRHILFFKKKEIEQKISKDIPHEKLNKIDNKTLNGYFAVPLAGVFGVSEKVIEIALNEINDK